MSRLILSNNQSRATLWFLDTCLIVIGLRKLRVRGHTVNIVQIKIVVLGWDLGFVVGVLVWCGITRQVFLYLTFGVVELVWWTMKHFYDQIPMTKSWKSIHAWTCIERNYFSFCRTVWNWRLFLAHPTYCHERVTSENTHESTSCWFCVFSISDKIRILKQSWSALLCCISHMTMLLNIICDECVRSNVLGVCHKLWPT